MQTAEVEKKQATVIDAPRLPEYGFLRKPQIIEALGIGRSTWYEWCFKGETPNGVKVPQGINLTSKIKVWRVEEIRDFIQRLTEAGRVGRDEGPRRGRPAKWLKRFEREDEA